MVVVAVRLRAGAVGMCQRVFPLSQYSVWLGCLSSPVVWPSCLVTLSATRGSGFGFVAASWALLASQHSFDEGRQVQLWLSHTLIWAARYCYWSEVSEVLFGENHVFSFVSGIHCSATWNFLSCYHEMTYDPLINVPKVVITVRVDRHGRSCCFYY